MRVEGEEERNEEVMRVPEGLVRLLSNLCMSSSEHEQHAQKHYMPSDTASLSVVYLDCSLLPNLGSLNIEETTKVSKCSPNALEEILT